MKAKNVKNSNGGNSWMNNAPLRSQELLNRNPNAKYEITQSCLIKEASETFKKITAFATALGCLQELNTHLVLLKTSHALKGGTSFLSERSIMQ